MLHGQPGLPGRGLAVKFAVIQFSLMGMWTSFLSFAMLYFKANGMEDAQAGLMVVTYSILGFSGRLLWGYVSDRLMRSKPVFMFCIFMAGVLPYAIRGVGEIRLKILIYGLMCFFLFPCSIVFDGWFFRKFVGREAAYGRIKGYGSVSLGLTAAAMGILIERLGWNAMFVSLSCFWAAALVTAALTPDVDRSPDGGRKRISLTPLIRNRSYVFITLWIVLAFGTGDTALQFWPVIISNAGGTTVHYGITVFLSALVQTSVYMLLARVISEIRPKLVMALSILIYVLPAFFGSFFDTVPPLILLYPLQGIGSAALILAAKLYVVKNTPGELKSSAQGVMEAFYNGFGGIISGSLGGLLMRLIGLRGEMRLSALLVVLVAAVMLISDLFDRRRAGTPA